MKKLVYASLAFLSVFTLAACSGHKEEAKVPEVKVEQKQAKFDEKLFKEAGILPFKSENHPLRVDFHLGQLHKLESHSLKRGELELDQSLNSLL